MRELINKEGVAQVITIEEGRVNIKRSVTIEHYFENKKIHKTTGRKKTPRWLLCTFKEKRKNCMKEKIYLKQILLKDKFAAKRYVKRLLVQIEVE